MTLVQGETFALLAAAIGLFAWGRFRYDLVALCVLLAGVLLGVVPARNAFDGFRDDVVVIIAMALVVSAAFDRSGVVEVVLRPLLGRLKTEASQAAALPAATAVLSMASKNVGALAIMIPIAEQLARRTGTSPSRLLMPMASASLLGGLVTLVGTSPNIIVSAVRQRAEGRPFGMYDFAPVGLSLTAIGLVYLAVGYRLLPKNRTAQARLSETLAGQTYLTEAVVPEDWPHARLRVSQLKAAEAGVGVAALFRDGERKDKPHLNTVIRAGDVIQLEGEAEALHKLIARHSLKPHRADSPLDRSASKEEVRSIEAVVSADSGFIGQSARRLDLQSRFNVKLLAVASGGRRMTRSLQSAPIRAGDVLVLRGPESALSKALTELGAKPLAERPVQLGGRRPLVLPAVVLACAMAAIALKLLPVTIAFSAAAVAMVLLGAIRMRDAYGALDAPVLVLIGALIPLSEALQRSGGADLIAQSLSSLFAQAPPLVVLVALTTAAMSCAPFLHNAPTVLILGPVAVDMARRLGLSPDPLLMGVAVGAGCDFLTPIGHQCNTLVLGPGGYRFSDYARLGAPLSLLVVAAGTPLIAWFWPLRG